MKTILAFDFESTGTNTVTDRIIQSSLILVDAETLKEIERKKQMFNPDGVPIHPKAFAAHGISETDLVGKPYFRQMAQKYYDYFNAADYLFGYNIKTFDVPLLIEEFGRCGLIYEPKPIIDSCTIFKIHESRTLSAALKFYCAKEMEGAHDAQNDVLASLEVLAVQKLFYGIFTNEDLVKESCYEGEDSRLSMDGKIVLREDGIACWNENFGKNKGKPVLDDIGYCQWILNSDFPFQTKNVIRNLLTNKK